MQANRRICGCFHLAHHAYSLILLLSFGGQNREYVPKPFLSFFLMVVLLLLLILSATAGEDYVGISKNLDFGPGIAMQTVRVTILDDLGQPVLEGPEKFELVLRMPMNGILGEPSKATVFINDSVSDCKCSSPHK